MSFNQLQSLIKKQIHFNKHTYIRNLMMQQSKNTSSNLLTGCNNKSIDKTHSKSFFHQDFPSTAKTLVNKKNSVKIIENNPNTSTVNTRALTSIENYSLKEEQENRTQYYKFHVKKFHQEQTHRLKECLLEVCLPEKGLSMAKQKLINRIKVPRKKEKENNQPCAILESEKSIKKSNFMLDAYNKSHTHQISLDIQPLNTLIHHGNSKPNRSVHKLKLRQKSKNQENQQQKMEELKENLTDIVVTQAKLFTKSQSYTRYNKPFIRLQKNKRNRNKKTGASSTMTPWNNKDLNLWEQQSFELFHL